jgi:hypothetical protein
MLAWKKSAKRVPVLLAGATLLAAGTLPMTGVALASAGRPAGSPPPIIWKPPPAKAPLTNTTLSPALASLTGPGAQEQTALLWTEPPGGRAGDEISYEIAADLKSNVWFPAGFVGAAGKGGWTAMTTQRPSAAPFGRPAQHMVIVTWSGAPDQKVWYALGDVAAKGVITWASGSSAIGGAFTSAGPTVFSPLHSDTVFVTWKAGSSRAIDYVIGEVVGSSITWGKIAKIPGAQTVGSPAVAEASTGKTAGRLYVLWTTASGLITGASTADPLAKGPVTWNAVASKVIGGAAPAATAIGPDSGFPLLVAYRSQKSSQLLYAQLFAHGPLTHEKDWTVPKLTSKSGPAVLPGVLAATDPDVDLMTYYVRACPAC